MKVTKLSNISKNVAQLWMAAIQNIVVPSSVKLNCKSGLEKWSLSSIQLTVFSSEFTIVPKFFFSKIVVESKLAM